MGRGLVPAPPRVGRGTRAPFLETPVLLLSERRPHQSGPAPTGARRPTRWCPTTSGRSLPGKSGREKARVENSPYPAGFRGRMHRAGRISGPGRRPNVLLRSRRAAGTRNRRGESSRPLPPRLRPPGSRRLPRLSFSRIRRGCPPRCLLIYCHAEELHQACPERFPIHAGVACNGPGRCTWTCSVRGEAVLSGRRSCLPRSSGHRWRSGPRGARGSVSPRHRPAPSPIVRTVVGVRLRVVDGPARWSRALRRHEGPYSRRAIRSPWPREIRTGRPSGAVFPAAHTAQHRRQLPRSCYAFRSRQSGCPSSPDSA